MFQEETIGLMHKARFKEDSSSHDAGDTIVDDNTLQVTSQSAPRGRKNRRRGRCYPSWDAAR